MCKESKETLGKLRNVLPYSTTPIYPCPSEAEIFLGSRLGIASFSSLKWWTAGQVTQAVSVLWIYIPDNEHYCFLLVKGHNGLFCAHLKKYI